MAQALSRFEAQFYYPLGSNHSFRIDHGKDYSRFFRSMGEAVCFVAERDGEVLGVVSASLRETNQPGVLQQKVLYIGDMKVNPTSRSGRLQFRLLTAIEQWGKLRTTAAFSIVMEGTDATPSRYTGRLGLPHFSKLAELVILQVPTTMNQQQHQLHALNWRVDEKRGMACFQRLHPESHYCFGGNPSMRSEMQAQWLMHPEAQACGRLEDTRRAKRLINDQGREMQSAHLSYVAYHDQLAGIELLRQACTMAAAIKMPSLFVSIKVTEADYYCQSLVGVIKAPATIYGTGIRAEQRWNMNTSEI